jgi:hypothetical protein
LGFVGCFLRELLQRMSIFEIVEVYNESLTSFGVRGDYIFTIRETVSKVIYSSAVRDHSRQPKIKCNLYEVGQ